jgi:hypothetical protein
VELEGFGAGEMPLFEPLSPTPDARTSSTFLGVKLDLSF